MSNALVVGAAILACVWLDEKTEEHLRRRQAPKSTGRKHMIEYTPNGRELSPTSKPSSPTDIVPYRKTRSGSESKYGRMPSNMAAKSPARVSIEPRDARLPSYTAGHTPIRRTPRLSESRGHETYSPRRPLNTTSAVPYRRTCSICKSLIIGTQSAPCLECRKRGHLQGEYLRQQREKREVRPLQITDGRSAGQVGFYDVLPLRHKEKRVAFAL
jgi:hypothetical protein